MVNASAPHEFSEFDVVHGFGDVEALFVISDKALLSRHSPDGSVDDTSSRHNLEARLLVRTPHYGEDIVAAGGSVHERIQDMLKPWCALADSCDHGLDTGLDVRNLRLTVSSLPSLSPGVCHLLLTPSCGYQSRALLPLAPLQGGKSSAARASYRRSESREASRTLRRPVNGLRPRFQVMILIVWRSISRALTEGEADDRQIASSHNTIVLT